MYVLSASNKRVSVDKLSRFEELNSASISYLGVSTPGDPAEIRASVPNLKELDFTGNLISNWKVLEQFSPAHQYEQYKMLCIKLLPVETAPVPANVSEVKPTTATLCSQVEGYYCLLFVRVLRHEL
ncbi:hypothetical protein V6N13_066377 [Hibiscus sabdariffa]